MAQEEGRRARKRYKNAPSYDEVKAKIDAKEKAAAERKAERAAARKPLTPAERYEQEKAARKDKSGGFSQHRMTGSRGHGSEYQNTRSIREEVLSYLLDEGFASDEKSAEAIMGAMSEAWVESIVEGGFNSSGRYDVGGGRTVGPVAGAVRSLFSGNLPKGQTYVPPSPQKGTNRPPAAPSSKNDSGKLTDFGAGGGKAKLKTGMSVGQVERQGRMNRGDYSG
jgi:hypothetical protein